MYQRLLRLTKSAATGTLKHFLNDRSADCNLIGTNDIRKPETPPVEQPDARVDEDHDFFVRGARATCADLRNRLRSASVTGGFGPYSST